MSGRVDAATLLERAVLAEAARGGLTLRVTAATARRWASATFVGARHLLTVEGEWDDRVPDWLRDLADADLPLRGHLVADLIVAALTRTDARFTAAIEALTLEEA